jgi:hypothetical protein
MAVVRADRYRKPHRLTEADVSAIIAWSYKLSEKGLVGASIPTETEDGELMVAVLDPENTDLLYGFGKDQSGYYAFDTRGRALTHGNSSIQDVLAALQTTQLAAAS